jgi:hypothetical protein
VTPINPRRACFYQGFNDYAEPLPERVAFRPFYPWTFHLPITTAAEFAEVRSWCSHWLDEESMGRWSEEFDHWHLGDEAAAKAFKAVWIDPNAKPVWRAPQVTG